MWELWHGPYSNEGAGASTQFTYNESGNCPQPRGHINHLESMVNATGNPGIYLQWEQRNPNAAFIQVQRATMMTGTYEPIVTLMAPSTDYLDQEGNSSYYYKICEIGGNNTVLSTSEPIMGEELLVKAALAYELFWLLKVRVHEEVGLFKRGRTSCSFAFPNWNSYPPPEIRISGPSSQGNQDAYIILDTVTPITTTRNSATNYPSGLVYNLDYRGNCYFLDSTGSPTAIDQADVVMASYEVRLFTASQMNQALYRALQSICAQPGAPKLLNVSSAPFWWDAALIAGASYFLIRSLLVSMANREWRLLVQDTESNAFDMMTRLEKAADTYKEEWKEYQTSLPRSQYPRTRSITVPEMMLPGARSRYFRDLWCASK